jgi:hypothetical protein
MKRTTRSGLAITYAEFWLDTLHCQGEPYLRVSTIRRNDKSIPLSRKEAKTYWFRRCFGVEFTDHAAEYIAHLLAWAQR